MAFGEGTRTSGRRIATAGLAAGAFVAALAVLEVGLRVREAGEGGAETSLQERLDESRRASLDDRADPVSLRGLVRASAHPGIVYEPKPGLRGRFQGRVVEINSHGMRDRERPRRKPPGTYRIVGLGDSVMFGWGVGQDETYLRLLEGKLASLPPPRPRYETLNFAVPGYNTAMEVATLEAKALAFEPDLVVIQFVNNDWGVPHFLRKPPDPWARDRLFLWDFVGERLGRVVIPDGDGLLDGSLADLERSARAEVLAPYRSMTGAAGYRRAMERLAALTTARGLPVVLIRGTCAEEQRRLIDDLAATHAFRVLDVGPVTDRVLRERGIPPEREARRKALWVSPDDHHPNALGHEIYALALFETIVGMRPEAGGG